MQYAQSQQKSNALQVACLAFPASGHTKRIQSFQLVYRPQHYQWECFPLVFACFLFSLVTMSFHVFRF